jgi:MHS family proline/betaine transporter-like MFS transporter
MMIGGSSIMTIADVLPAPAAAPNRSVVAAVIGNAMEWYDFAVYGFFASTIGKLFFPASEPSLSVIAALAVFAVGFLMRPIGGVAFGYIGDRYGRTFSLFLSIGAMALGTLAMGLLPTYQTAGMLAPILMITCRIVQGLAVGGEYATSIIVLVESAPVGRRGFRGSLACLGATAGNLLGSATGAFLFHSLDESQIAEWGWRIPFLMGVAVAVTGIYLRRKFTAEDCPASNNPGRFFRIVLGQWPAALRVAGINIAAAIGFYMIFVYLVQYMATFSHLGEATALMINSINMAVLLLIIPAAGHVSDIVGRKAMMSAALSLLILCALPLFKLLQSGDETLVFTAQLGFTAILGCYLGTIPAVLVEQFPAAVRCTGSATSYNVVHGLFGGTTPMVCVLLISAAGNNLLPALYLILAAVIALATVCLVRETAFGELRA